MINEYLDSICPLNIVPAKKNYKRNNNSTGFMTVKIKKALSSKWNIIEYFKPNLLTNGGRDWIHAQVYTNTAAGTVGANFIAVSSDAVAPAVTDTTLASEIVTSGLSRAAASPVASHTSGTNSSTIQVTYTASGTLNNVQKTAIFNAVSSGIMVHENTFTPTNLVSGDSLQITWNVTLG